MINVINMNQKRKKSKRRSLAKQRKAKRLQLLKEKEFTVAHYVTTVREVYGIKELRKKWNIESGLQHLREVSRYQPSGISFTIANLSSKDITVQYMHNGEWTTPEPGSGKDKYLWSDVPGSNKFPKTDYPSIKQLTAHFDTQWRIVYDEDGVRKIFHFTLIRPKNESFNKHIVFFTDNKKIRISDVSEKQLETFIVNQVNAGKKLNIEAGLRASWATK